MLHYEGVLIAQGSRSVRWFHYWLREYSLVDLIVSDIKSIGPVGLAGRVIRLSDHGHRPDYVVRTAAVDGAKWAVAYSVGDFAWPARVANTVSKPLEHRARISRPRASGWRRAAVRPGRRRGSPCEGSWSGCSRPSRSP